MISRAHIVIRGAVQGVGFRPFIYKLATEMNLKGFVLNSSKGVFIEVESKKEILQNFILRIEKEKPKLSLITNFETTFLDPVNYNKFEIKESKNEKETSALILPDISTCPDCLKEMLNPSDRRYLYPFINCTNCGPRFSIIESLPYDRPNTSMKSFKMCDKCKDEYENPLDRRFHAQPTACPDCGPQIELLDANGENFSEKNEALLETIKLINDGKIIALKGLGGFQLIVDASNKSVVNELRIRKKRDGKPFALMFPDLASVKRICNVDKIEERLLTSPEKPIVLLKKIIRANADNIIAENVAPNNPYLGIMLPYTPLHFLLMREFKKPIIATSGNISEEPMCIDNDEALNRLKGIADYFLVNNRPIIRHVDDSIVRVINNRELVLRRARGFAPLPLHLDISNTKSVLSVGGHLKNTISLLKGDNLFISQHIGDLSTKESNKAFVQVIKDFKNLYKTEPQKVITDLHPDYISAKYSQNLNIPIEKVQHHYAHIAACRLENKVTGDALGVSWDGTGFGLDGSIWGSEFFISGNNYYKHIGQFRKFKLPGGEKAVKEPKRIALSILYEIFGNDIDKKIFKDVFTPKEIDMLISIIDKKINSPLTSSAGRLFDAVSSLIGLCHISNYEAEAAMQLEFCADENETGYYPFKILQENIFIVDWQPIIESILNDINLKLSIEKISAKFHNTLSQIILAVAKKTKLKKVILSGGCFQNKILTENTIKILNKNNYQVYCHQRIPPNDGGISVGQIAAYLLGSIKEENKNNFKEELAVKES